ncbi:MAG: amidohydrolase family protein [Saprospiraceae bacterium]
MLLRKLLPLLIFFIILSHTGLQSQSSPLVIQNINWIDVVNGQSNFGTILIENDRIRSVNYNGPFTTDMQIVNGQGKWLMPGMIDAHIHLFQSGGLYTRPDVLDLTEFRDYETERKWVEAAAPDFLKRYLRCGITTVIDVGGPMSNYEIRNQYGHSTAYPNLFLTGPLVSTYQPEAFQIDDPPIIKVDSKEEAVALVQQQLPYQPDFIKIWYIVLPGQSAEATYEIVQATIEESHRHGLKVAVHATQLETARLAVQAGADILVHSVDDPLDEVFINELINKKVVYIPTLTVHGNYVTTFKQDTKPSQADFLLANPLTLGSLYDPEHFPAGNALEKRQANLPAVEKYYHRTDSINRANLKRLTRYPVTIATGTDAGNIGTLHAASYYDEMLAMQDAGMSAAQILQASTINGAKVLDKDSDLGSVEDGKIADLILLNANPLDDIRAVQDVAYVIKSGQLMATDTMLTETPEYLVQQQLNGYNARNIEAFLAPYSEEVELYNFPDILIGKGKDNIRPNYQNMFNQIPELHCKLMNRTILGNTVIDQEYVTGFPNGNALEAIAIYKIENHKIAKVYFIAKN